MSSLWPALCSASVLDNRAVDPTCKFQEECVMQTKWSFCSQTKEVISSTALHGRHKSLRCESHNNLIFADKSWT